MRSLFVHYKWLFLVILLGSGIFFFAITKDDEQTYSTAVVERGTVQSIVTVSGFVEAKQTADLGFPASGRVSGVYVEEGETVTAGALLASIGSASLAAQRQRLNANLIKVLAIQDEVANGPTTESRAVTDSTIAQAQTALQQTTATELQKVQNALVTLRSSDLAAYTPDIEETAPAPNITGTYTCAEEGSYLIDVYRSGTLSGYSFTLSGLEAGIYTATMEQPGPLGDCGLFIQFAEGEQYSNSEWVVEIPNTRSSSYTTLQNTYTLAAEQATQNIAAARSALTLAQDQGTAQNAAPRVEALLQANADVVAAQAAIANVDAQLRDNSITAPFDGIVTSIDIQPGEIARTDVALKLIGKDSYTVTARIPEIDITKVALGQPVKAIFDANTAETVSGTIGFVSPVATEIDGVGYFETTIILDTTPNWLRAGLNADIDIITAESKDTLRLPNQFITTTPSGQSVQTVVDDEVITSTVEIGLTGNSGYSEVINLTEGTTIVAP